MSELTDRLRELSRAVSDGRMGEFTMRVPAEPKRDADIVLADAADEIERLQSQLGDCAPYLKEGEPPAECIARNRHRLSATKPDAAGVYHDRIHRDPETPGRAARVLGSLAPELLAALRNLLNATEDTLREHVETGCCYVTHQRCNEARALIAKATELPPDVRCQSRENSGE